MCHLNIEGLKRLDIVMNVHSYTALLEGAKYKYTNVCFSSKGLIPEPTHERF